MRRNRLIVTLTTFEYGVGVLVPGALEQRSGESDAPSAASSSSSTASSFGLSSSRPAGTGRDALAGVEADVAARRASAAAAGWLRRASARMRATSSANANGLAQVVVGAEAEPVDAVARSCRAAVSIRTRAALPRSTSVRQTSSPWMLRQVAVEHDHVVVLARGMDERVLAVEGDIDGHPSRRSPTAIVAASSL